MAAFAAVLYLALGAPASPVLQSLAVFAILTACAQTFLLIAVRRQADVVFWAVVVPMLLYAFGAGLAVVDGVLRPDGAPVLPDAESLAALLVCAILIGAEAIWSQQNDQRVHSAEHDTARWAIVVGVSGVGVASLVALFWQLARTAPPTPGQDGQISIFIGLVMAASAAWLALDLRYRLSPDEDVAVALSGPPPADQPQDRPDNNSTPQVVAKVTYSESRPTESSSPVAEAKPQMITGKGPKPRRKRR
jgi:hypothetical protein